MFIISTKVKISDNYVSRISQNNEITFLYSFVNRKDADREFSKVKNNSSLYEMNKNVKLIATGIKTKK